MIPVNVRMNSHLQSIISTCLFQGDNALTTESNLNPSILEIKRFDGGFHPALISLPIYVGVVVEKIYIIYFGVF